MGLKFIDRYITKVIDRELSKRLDKLIVEIVSNGKTTADHLSNLTESVKQFLASRQMLTSMLHQQQIWILAYYRLFISQDPSLISAYNREVFITTVVLLLKTMDLMSTDTERLEVQSRIDMLKGSAVNNEKDEWFVTAEQEYLKEKGMI